jgi:PAB-dependent poly(A)-specific ribonuclease subunit 3
MPGQGGPGAFSVDSPEFTPGVPQPQAPSMMAPSGGQGFQPGPGAAPFDPSAGQFQPMGGVPPGMEQMQPGMGQGGMVQGMDQGGMDQGGMDQGGMDGYGMQQSQMPNQQMTERMMGTEFPSLLPHIARAQQKARANRSDGFFMSEDLRKDLIGRQFATTILFDDPALGIPAQVDNYHSLYPLETPSLEPGSVFGFSSILYKGINVGDGLPYAMRRMVNVKLTDVAAMDVVERWKKIQHPNVIAIKEVFTTKDFGDNSAVFTHDFHPLAQTLHTRHLTGRTSFVQESLLWSYIIQMTAALRAIHNQGLACRVIHASKVVVTGRSRIMLGSTSVFEILQYAEDQNTREAINHFQQKDLVELGKLILNLACNTLTEMFREAMLHSMQHVASNYSTDLARLIQYLIGPAPGYKKTLNDLMPMIGARFYTELETQSGYMNLLESELSKEVQNGRLMRLITKLEFVIDRPEHKGDPRFGETGDRFLLKLMRDYVFHQTAENGEPWLDLAHVVQCLNNLDYGSPSKVCLVTPDEKNIMIVSYFDMKECLDKAYAELIARD